MPSVISNTFSVIGGAVVGAVAMYLLDPDQGEDRRQDVASTATDAVSATHQAVKSTAGGASDSAYSVRNTIAKYAKRLASGVGDHVSDAADSVSDSAGDAADAVKAAHKQTKAKVADAVSSAQSYGRGLFKSAASTKDDWLDHASNLVEKGKSTGRRAVKAPEPHPVSTVTGITAAGLGTLALGAAFMYYLDPERGRTRRALLRDKTYSVTRQSGDKARRYGHHLGNKAHGYAAQARQIVPADWVDKARATIGSTSDTPPTATH